MGLRAQEPYVCSLIGTAELRRYEGRKQCACWGTITLL